MHMHTDAERLYDFEATLRLVDNALDDLQVLGVERDRTEGDELFAGDGGPEAEISDLTPLRAFREVQEGLHSLRHGRAILERTAEGRDGPRRDESADRFAVSATDALGGLDRALSLVDRFEADQDGGPDGAALFQSIREEIRVAMTCLQVHDVTEQQLSYASSILLDMDGRLAQLADMLDPYGFDTAGGGLLAGTRANGASPRRATGDR
jgi:hypothetical protein